MNFSLKPAFILQLQIHFQTMQNLFTAPFTKLLLHDNFEFSIHCQVKGLVQMPYLWKDQTSKILFSVNTFSTKKREKERKNGSRHLEKLENERKKNRNLRKVKKKSNDFSCFFFSDLKIFLFSNYILECSNFKKSIFLNYRFAYFCIQRLLMTLKLHVCKLGICKY